MQVISFNLLHSAIFGSFLKQYTPVVYGVLIQLRAGANNLKYTVMSTTKSEVTLTKEVLKAITKVRGCYEPDNFINDANKWIEAIKERRLLCVIPSVSRSGMSRRMKFHACIENNSRENKEYYYRNFTCFLEAIGMGKANNEGAINVSGCGMDMVFHVNYTIIHQLHRMGFITESECRDLAQQTPTVL